DTPETAEDIRTRLRELSFNSTFLREMRMFAHLHEHIAAPNLPAWLLDRLPIARFERRLAGLRFHAISAEHVLGEMPSDSKLAVSHAFFEDLFTVGRAHARRWLEQHGTEVGKRPSLDLASLFY
ncbi:MAG: patatin-like phospholipase family protein, partial [Betaproteobacteria bacterium]|nr:patatin-like phospholipase family protein [Betaproteobacteria bacterium]